MSGQDDGHSLAANFGQIVPQVGPGAGIEAGRGLVEQQQPGAVEHALGQLDAAAQAAREGFAALVGPSVSPRRLSISLWRLSNSAPDRP